MKIPKSSLPIKVKTDETLNTRLSNRLNFPLLISSLLIIIIGLISVYSSTYNLPELHQNFYKQLYFAIFGLVIGAIVIFIPPKFFELLAVPIYIFSIFLLILVLLIGKTVGGNQSWIQIGTISLQPSEISKYAVILMLAYVFSQKHFNINSLKGFLTISIIVAIPTMLIFLQKDIGTALIFFAVFIFGLFWNGLSAFSVFVLISPIISAFASLLGIIPSIVTLILVIITLFYFKREFFLSLGIFGLNLSFVILTEIFIHLLSPHQVKRIKNFIDQQYDPLGSGYNALQAKIAVGSGGLFGEGFLAGSQTQLKFIPKQWTDFIFCVVGEEFGFVGSIFVLSLYFILITQLIRIARLVDSAFQSSVIIMFVSVFLFHTFVNIGMTIGLVPVIGIPLPLMSYGGSALVTNILMISTAMNFYRHRTI